VPATMELLGDANWWFPKWLGWLPKIHIEGKPADHGVETIGDPDRIEGGGDRQPQPVG